MPPRGDFGMTREAMPTACEEMFTSDDGGK